MVSHHLLHLHDADNEQITELSTGEHLSTDQECQTRRASAASKSLTLGFITVQLNIGMKGRVVAGKSI